jgi:hypothetical protein
MKVNMAMDGVGVMVAHGVVDTAVHGIIIMADMVIITVVGAEVMEEDIIVFMVAAVVGATYYGGCRCCFPGEHQKVNTNVEPSN